MRLSTKNLLPTIKRSTLLLCGVLLLVNGGYAYAQNFTKDDLSSINGTTPWYDPNFGECTATQPSTSTTTSTAPVGNGNMEKVFRFFVGHGLTADQAAGIVGNIMQESRINPKSDNPKAVGGGGGIAQWEGPRWSGPNGLLAFVDKYNAQHPAAKKTWQDLGLQLDFLWGELPGQTAHGHLGELQAILPNATSDTSAIEAVKLSTTYGIAAQAYEYTFERASEPVMHNRVTNAGIVLAQAKKNHWGGDAPAGTPTQVSETVQCTPTSAEDSAFVDDGFTIYNQCDGAWGSKPYGDADICEAGCGPSAMAMIITNLTNTHITPDVTAAYADSQNLYIPGKGSSWDIAKVVGTHWGLKVTKVDNSVAKINDVLNSGGLVIGAGSPALPFTVDGHFIVIRAVTTDGKWKIGDSGHKDTNKKTWDPASISENMRDGSVYAVTK